MFSATFADRSFAILREALYYSALTTIERMSKNVSELAAYAGGALTGDGNIQIMRVAGLASATAGEIAYVADEKFFEEFGKRAVAKFFLKGDFGFGVAA